MDRAERRFKSEVKDLKRRHLYLNNVINGRFEVPDNSVEIRDGYADTKAFRSTLDPDVQSNYKRLKAGEGYWSEYPKNKNYKSRGYFSSSKIIRNLRSEEKSNQETEGIFYEDK